MKLTDRLLKYLEYKELSIHYFEMICGIGNGYFGKQHRGKGSMGSDILEKIAVHYPDLNLNWLVTGRGSMLHRPPRGVKPPEDFMLKEEQAVYNIRNKLMDVLKDQIKTLEKALPKGRKVNLKI